jgi:hypothetical protein
MPTGGETPESQRGSLDAQIITCSQLTRVLADWRKPRHEAFEPRTAWSLFNCFTGTLKGTSLGQETQVEEARQLISPERHEIVHGYKAQQELMEVIARLRGRGATRNNQSSG